MGPRWPPAADGGAEDAELWRGRPPVDRGQPAAALLLEVLEPLDEEEPEDDEELEDDELPAAAGAASFLPLDDEPDSLDDALDRLSVR